MKNWKEVCEEYDKEFGRKVNGEDGNFDSVGKMAGCDNCETNILEREAHRDFFKSQFKQIMEEMVGEERGISSHNEDGNNFDCPIDEHCYQCEDDSYDLGWNAKRQEILDKINDFFKE